uniref:C-type lectin domain-containing protein n=1 Tax=Panagrolaimus davidi TaxID=227884 RepID=A0A914PWM8_9BILA
MSISGCLCRPGTTQFSALIPLHNGDVPYITEYYADCIYKAPDTNEKISFEGAEMVCISDINFDSRLIALNTSAKWNFTKNFLGAEPNFFWSGKDGTQWINYSDESRLPVDYLPLSYYDPTLQGICQNTFNITAGKGAAIGSRFLCEASVKMAFLSLCETRAFDSTNNPKLCSSGFKNKKHA